MLCISNKFDLHEVFVSCRASHGDGIDVNASIGRDVAIISTGAFGVVNFVRYRFAAARDRDGTSGAGCIVGVDQGQKGVP